MIGRIEFVIRISKHLRKRKHKKIKYTSKPSTDVFGRSIKYISHNAQSLKTEFAVRSVV